MAILLQTYIVHAKMGISIPFLQELRLAMSLLKIM